MTDWNPIKGLKKLAPTEIRVGDVIRIHQQTGVDAYMQVTVKEVIALSDGSAINVRTCEGNIICFYPQYSPNVAYLVERAVTEPTGRGDLAEIYRPNPEGEESEEVETYIRTRPSHLDVSCGISAWTDTDNDVSMSWTEITDMVNRIPEFALRTYTATHKAN